jgi:predicted RNA-binding protein with PIN domain
MKPRIIVDGYNLIYQFPELRRMIERDLESARDGLLNYLLLYARENHIHITVVFDGDSRNSFINNKKRYLQIRFSKYPEKADLLIKKMIEETKKTVSLLVVSSDREIMNFTKLCGFQTMSSQRFVLTLLPKLHDMNAQSGNPDMSNDEFMEWMRLFQETSHYDGDSP